MTVLILLHVTALLCPNQSLLGTRFSLGIFITPLCTKICVSILRQYIECCMGTGCVLLVHLFSATLSYLKLFVYK